jgi:hypothetical protein
MVHHLRAVGRGGFIVGSVLLAFAVSDASADATHYQTLQLGERSRGMAAAYTGFAADGAAIWFNPATSVDISMIPVRNCDTPVSKEEIALPARSPS